MAEKLNPTVEAYAGCCYPERPMALWWDDKRLEVDKIISQSQTPDGRQFLIQAQDGQKFHLGYMETSGGWTITPITL